jgi:AraC-like DNA-binding protein
MAAQMTNTGAPDRVAFSTSELDLAVAYLNEAYHTDMRIRGTRGTFSHSRVSGGPVAIDEMHWPSRGLAREEPFDALVVITHRSGLFERECGGVTEQFGPGEVYLNSDPSLPTTIRFSDFAIQAVMLDLPLLAQVANTSDRRAPGPIRFTSYQPASEALAANWKNVANYLSEVMGDPAFAEHDLIRGNAARLAAATALATFPNTALTPSTPRDRRDATSETVRRASAYIEQYADRDISLADIAEAARVSIRTLQLAFRNHLDTTPMRNLRAVRLGRVHQELLTADPGSGSMVTDIALRWGFYSHSRFAAQYRQAYGVSPRDTLRAG